MSLIPAAHFLVDFGSKDAAPAIVEEAPDPTAITKAVEAAWAQKVDEAYARGCEDGRRAAEAEANALIEASKAESTDALTAARQAWCADEGPKLAAQLTTAVSEMQATIAAAVEIVLGPFVAQMAREEAIRQLRVMLEDLVTINSAIALDVSGPQDLLDALRDSLGETSLAVRFHVRESCDVEIKAGASILETRIAEWMQTARVRLA